MTVLGIDLSTKATAFVWLADDGTVERTLMVEVPGKLAADRFDRLASWSSTWIAASPDGDLVVIEGLPFVKSRAGFSALAQVLGMLRAACVRHERPYVVVPGSDWKKGLGLSGNANKDAVCAWAEAEGFVNPSQDLTDAYCIARYGLQLVAAAA